MSERRVGLAQCELVRADDEDLGVTADLGEPGVGAAKLAKRPSEVEHGEVGAVADPWIRYVARDSNVFIDPVDEYVFASATAAPSGFRAELGHGGCKESRPVGRCGVQHTGSNSLAIGCVCKCE